jgi:hypothetical protein
MSHTFNLVYAWLQEANIPVVNHGFDFGCDLSVDDDIYG